MTTTHRTVPTQTVVVGGRRVSYRRLGADSGVPVILLNHLGAVLDNWDPRVVDGIAAQHPVITFDGPGVGASQGTAPTTVAEMAKDAIAFIRALGFTEVDLFGFSLGGFVAQEIVRQQPGLVRRIILAGTGPAGGEGIEKVTGVTISDSVKATLVRKDPKENLFFTKTANGKAEGRRFIERLKERTDDRDKPISPLAFRRQLKAVHNWGTQKPFDLSGITQPVFVANGDHDRMVPTSNSTDLARRLPNARLRIYSDAGHGGIFQYHDQFVTEALEFLA
ncbi:MAG: alpha/beta fold hydrolase [Candidatus Nanopelagicales bacterium]